MASEIWKDIPGYEGRYYASSHGRIRGARWGNTLKPSLHQRGYLKFSIWDTSGEKRTMMVHKAVALAFLPNPENLPLVRHLDDDPLNNSLENLAWGSLSDNMLDAVRNGVHPESRKTHCPRNHPYSPENTAMDAGSRRCRICRRDRQREAVKQGKEDSK